MVGLETGFQSVDCLTGGADINALIADQGQQGALVTRGNQINAACQCGRQHMVVVGIVEHNLRHTVR